MRICRQHTKLNAAFRVPIRYCARCGIILLVPCVGVSLSSATRIHLDPDSTLNVLLDSGDARESWAAWSFPYCYYLFEEKTVLSQSLYD